MRLRAAATLDTLNHEQAAHAAAEKILAAAQSRKEEAEQTLRLAQEAHQRDHAAAARLDAEAEAERLRLQSITHHVEQLRGKVEQAEADAVAARHALGAAHGAMHSAALTTAPAAGADSATEPAASAAANATRANYGPTRWRWFGVPLALAGLAAAMYLVPRHLPPRLAPVVPTATTAPAAPATSAPGATLSTAGTTSAAAQAGSPPVYPPDPGARRDLKLSYEIKSAPKNP